MHKQGKTRTIKMNQWGNQTTHDRSMMSWWNKWSSNRLQKFALPGGSQASIYLFSLIYVFLLLLLSSFYLLCFPIKLRKLYFFFSRIKFTQSTPYNKEELTLSPCKLSPKQPSSWIVQGSTLFPFPFSFPLLCFQKLWGKIKF